MSGLLPAKYSSFFFNSGYLTKKLLIASYVASAVEVSFHAPQSLPLADGPTGLQYEYPTGGGIDIATILATFCQPYGL